MHTVESPTEEIKRKMLRELHGLLTWYRWLVIAGIIIGGWLLVQALSLIGAAWMKFGIGWLGISIIGITCWIYLYAYRGARQELFFFRDLLGLRRTTKRRTVLKYSRDVWRLAGSGFSQAFLGGLLIALLVATTLQDKYEDRFFQSLSHKVELNDHALPEDSILLRAMGVCHTMLEARSMIFANNTETSLVDTWLHPISTDLIAADGSCGSYSSVLGRLLQTMGYPIRFVQMKVDKEYGGHILLEALTARGWVALDPLYNICFIRPDGQIASFGDVAANWPYYRRQTPAGYDQRYCYQGVRYTNWSKIPVILPLVKKGIGLFMNADALQHFSLRVYLLRKYLVLTYALLFLLLLLSLSVAKKIIGRIFPSGSAKRKLPFLIPRDPVARHPQTWAVMDH